MCSSPRPNCMLNTHPAERYVRCDIMIIHWHQWKWQIHSALLQEISLLSLPSFCQSRAEYVRLVFDVTKPVDDNDGYVIHHNGLKIHGCLCFLLRLNEAVSCYLRKTWLVQILVILYSQGTNWPIRAFWQFSRSVGRSNILVWGVGGGAVMGKVVNRAAWSKRHMKIIDWAGCTDLPRPNFFVCSQSPSVHPCSSI